METAGAAASIAHAALAKPAAPEAQQPAAGQAAADAAPKIGPDGKPITPPAPDTAAKFAALAQAEKARRGKEAELKQGAAKLEQERQTLAAEKAELAKVKAELEEYRGWKSKAKAAPLDVLKALGIDYDAVTAQKLNGEKPTTEQVIAPLAEKLTALEQKLAKEREDATAAKQKQSAAELASLEKRFDESCSAFVAKSETHPLTKVYDGAPLVGQIVREHWQIEEKQAASEGRDPKMLSIAEAADLAEKWYEEKHAAALAAKQPKTPAAQQPAAKPPANADRKSLSGDMTPTSVSEAGKRLSMKAKQEAVLRKIRAGQL